MLSSAVTVNLATGTASDGTNTVTWTPLAIENVTGGTVNDDLRGNESDNTLNGQGGDDTISGGGGNDRISGGSGVDTVYGDSPDASTPAGDDTIDVADGDAGDTVDCGPNTILGGDKVEVDAKQDPSTGEIFRVDTTNCENVNEVLIN